MAFFVFLFRPIFLCVRSLHPGSRSVFQRGSIAVDASPLCAANHRQGRHCRSECDGIALFVLVVVVDTVSLIVRIPGNYIVRRVNHCSDPIRPFQQIHSCLQTATKSPIQLVQSHHVRHTCTQYSIRISVFFFFCSRTQCRNSVAQLTLPNFNCHACRTLAALEPFVVGVVGEFGSCVGR